MIKCYASQNYKKTAKQQNTEYLLKNTQTLYNYSLYIISYKEIG